MARTSPVLVESIVEVDSSIDLLPFIGIANLVVTRYCTGGTMTADELEAVERYLAAHFYCLRDRQMVRTKTGQSDDIFESKIGLGLDHTRYGQTAKVLDATGKLDGLSKIKAGGFHVGLDCCEREL